MAQPLPPEPPTDHRRGFLAALAGLFAAACGVSPAASTGTSSGPGRRGVPGVLDAGTTSGDGDAGYGSDDAGERDAGERDAGAGDADAGAGADDAGESEGDAGEPDPAEMCDVTPSDSLGPYYTPNAPFRDDLIDEGMLGAPLTVKGRVRNDHCLDVADALVDVWHCDDRGAYDNQGYTLRGRLYADGDGEYAFRTILPGYYEPRPRHIHVRVSAPGHEVLTTQLYFAGDPENNNPDVGKELTVTEGSNGELIASFDFTLRRQSAP